MRVSAIVPVRDGRRYLGETLESLLGQRRPPEEVIVVDDGSSDGSADVARAYAGVTVLVRPAAGAAAARNAGARVATGDALAFHDADDLAEPGHVEELVAALHGDPQAVLAAGRVRTFLSPDRAAELAGRYAVPADDALAFLAGTMLIRRSAFLETGGFDEALPAGEVVDWVRRQRACGARVAQIDALVLRRRIHGGNMSLQRATLRAGYLAAARAAILERKGAA